jgi:hypothetical protein
VGGRRGSPADFCFELSDSSCLGQGAVVPGARFLRRVAMVYGPVRRKPSWRICLQGWRGHSNSKMDDSPLNGHADSFCPVSHMQLRKNIF